MLLKNLVLVACLSFAVSGCYVRARASLPHVRVKAGHAHHHASVNAPRVVYTVDDYEPEYYDDYVVYYDDVGEPYYYNEGRVVYVGRTHPRYSYYRTHYHTHRDVYRSWHARHRSNNYYRRGQWRPARRR